MRVMKNSLSYWTDDEGNEYEKILRVSMNASERKKVLRRPATRRGFIKNLQDVGYIPKFGCDCSHCQMDRDCCGRMFLSFAYVFPARKGVHIVQQYSRNV